MQNHTAGPIAERSNRMEQVLPAGDLVPGSRRVMRKKKKKTKIILQVQNLCVIVLA